MSTEQNSSSNKKIADLNSEGCDRSGRVVELLVEFACAAASQGAGINRDPANVFRELCGEARDLRATLHEQRDDIEREARGLQS